MKKTSQGKAIWGGSYLVVIGDFLKAMRDNREEGTQERNYSLQLVFITNNY